MKHIQTFESFNQNEGLKEFGQKLGIVKDPEKMKEKAIKDIMSHKTKKEAYQKFLSEDKEKANKYVEFWIKNPNAKYCRWDEKLKKFVDSGIAKDASGILGTRGLSEKKIN